jgi:transcriptional regulator with XRE-family HTH domain
MLLALALIKGECMAMTSKDSPRIDWRAVYRRLPITRLVLGITEREAAVAAGVSLRTYRKWEAGHDRQTDTGILAFAFAYDVSLDWLVDGECGWLLGRLAAKNASAGRAAPVQGQAA